MQPWPQPEAQPALGLLEMIEITRSETTGCLPSEFCDVASSHLCGVRNLL